MPDTLALISPGHFSPCIRRARSQKMLENALQASQDTATHDLPVESSWANFPAACFQAPRDAETYSRERWRIALIECETRQTICLGIHVHDFPDTRRERFAWIFGPDLAKVELARSRNVYIVLATAE